MTPPPLYSPPLHHPEQPPRCHLSRQLHGHLRVALLDPTDDGAASLVALATSYEAMARALDNSDQAALLAVYAAAASGDDALVDDMIESTTGQLDELEIATWSLSLDIRDQLEASLDLSEWAAINRYLSLVPSNPSDFDRFLEGIDFRLNLTELYTLLDALGKN